MISDWKDMLSSIYGVAADTKNFLFNHKLLDQVQIPVPVLSVGNLSVGGTGKTPVVQSILSRAISQGLQVGVIARNYRARSRGIHQVDPQRRDGGFFYGDEPYLLAQKFPQASVWTGPQKFLTAQYALTKGSYQLLIVDDGFQHRSLHRSFDLVLLDATTSLEENQLLPKGRLREDFASLERASAVAITKVNWAQPHRVDDLKTKIPKHLDVYEIEFSTTPQKRIEAGARVLSVCGIAQPKIFEKSLATLSNPSFEVVENLVFPDHHEYTAADVKRISERMKSLECRQLLTTEKDYVKLKTFPDLGEVLNPIVMETRFREEPQGLYAFLDNCLRH